MSRIRTSSAARSSFPAQGGEWEAVPVRRPWTEGDQRSLGVADMAAAIRQRPHRASGALALHVLEVMEGFRPLGGDGRFMEIATRPERRPARRGPRSAGKGGA